MKILSNAVSNALNSGVSKPAYIIEIMWAEGLHGTEGASDYYFGTCSVNEIVGFPFSSRYSPTLLFNSLNSMTEKFDALNGNSTIGQVNFSIADGGDEFAAIMRRAEADVRQSIRRQRVQLYQIERGSSWDERIKLRTANVIGLEFDINQGTWNVQATSILGFIKKPLFTPKIDKIVSISVSGDYYVLGLTDVKQFRVATYHSLFGGMHSGFVKVGNEIMRWETKGFTEVKIPSVGRGMFGTPIETHAIDDEVSEVAVLRGNPYHLILQMLTSKNGDGSDGVYDVLPPTWGAHLDINLDVDEASFRAVGQQRAGWDGTLESGVEYTFVITETLDIKTIIERHIFIPTGAFGRTLGDGRYSCKFYEHTAKPIFNINTKRLAASESIKLLTEEDIVKITRFQIDYAGYSPFMRINYAPDPFYGKDYKRHAIFTDLRSANRFGYNAKVTEHNIVGIEAKQQNVDILFAAMNAAQARYATPPVVITATLMPQHADIEVGDQVGIDMLQVNDAFGLWQSWDVMLSEFQEDNPAAITFPVQQGDIVVTSLNTLYVCISQGTSGTVSPAFETGYEFYDDGSARWMRHDGHLSRVITVDSVTEEFKSGAVTISGWSQPYKSKVYLPNVVLSYRFADSAYFRGIPLDIYGSITVDGAGVRTLTMTGNVTLDINAARYYFDGNIVISNGCVLNLVRGNILPNFEIYATGKIITQVNSVITGDGQGLFGGDYNRATITHRYGSGNKPKSWFYANPLNHGEGRSTNTLGGAGFGGTGGGSYEKIPVPINPYGIGTGRSYASNIRPIIMGSALDVSGKYTKFIGAPTVTCGGGGGSGAAAGKAFYHPALGGRGGHGGAGLTFICRGVELDGIINLRGENGTGGFVFDLQGRIGSLAGIAYGGGGGGGGSFFAFVERNPAGTHSMLYNTARIRTNGGAGALTSGDLNLQTSPATAGATGAIYIGEF